MTVDELAARIATLLEGEGVQLLTPEVVNEINRRLGPDVRLEGGSVRIVGPDDNETFRGEAMESPRDGDSIGRLEQI